MTTRTDTATLLLTQRDAALQRGDVGAFMNVSRRMGHAYSSYTVAEVAFHKLRYEVVTMPDAVRHESREWLETRGYKRWRGLPWPRQGKLKRAA